MIDLDGSALQMPQRAALNTPGCILLLAHKAEAPQTDDEVTITTTAPLHTVGITLGFCTVPLHGPLIIRDSKRTLRDGRSVANAVRAPEAKGALIRTAALAPRRLPPTAPRRRRTRAHRMKR